MRNNRFAQLPDALTELGQLQVLDVTDNKLKQLPKSIGKLHALQTLNARGKKGDYIIIIIIIMKYLASPVRRRQKSQLNHCYPLVSPPGITL